jgi:hypothetical protein
MAAEAGQSKEEMLDVLLLVAPKVAELDSVQKESVIGFMKEQFPFEISVDELKGLFATKRTGLGKTAMLLAFSLLVGKMGFAADGNAGIQQATQMVKGYFDTGCDLMYAIGAIVGIIGGVKVFQKWNAGEPDTSKVAASWFGSCIFLVVVATVIRSFFGL